MCTVGKFKYKGYTFIPVGRLNPKMDLYKASKYLVSNRVMGLCNYAPYNEKGWTYRGFYRAVPAEYKNIAEVFYCVETGNKYVPSDNELFLWTGPFEAIK